MALELKLGLKLSQQLVMTPQLQQAIKLLQLNRMELAELITQELVENPVLEENMDTEDQESKSQEDSNDPEVQQKRDEEAFEKPKDAQEDVIKGKDDFNWEAYVEDYNSSHSTAPSMREVNEDLPSYDQTLTRSSSLEEHVVWQLSMATLADNEVKFGTLVSGNLNADGYLKDDLASLAKESGLELEDAEEVLNIIKDFDPVGVGSRDLRECLLTQAKFLNPRQPLLEKIIDQHLSNLERKNYSTIAKNLGVSQSEIIEATKLIMELEPKPGRAFQTSDNHYITPDIYVYKIGNEYVIVLNEDGLPKLRISPYYKDILSSSGGAGASQKSKDTKEYVQEKLRSAMWLIRSIHNRQKTIYKVTEAIVSRQRDFF